MGDHKGRPYAAFVAESRSDRRFWTMRDATALRSPRPGRGRAGNNAECVPAVAAPGPRPECGRCGATVGDGLVPSLADAAAVTREGEDKPRPYGPVPTATTDKPVCSVRGVAGPE